MYIVAWMQADGRFVQDVEDPAQVRPKLRGQPDSLRLAAAQCFCRPPEREITKSDFFHETESLLDLGQKTGCDHLMRVFEFQLVDHVDRKSTRLNSSHRCISYAVFCLKQKTFSRICQ